MGSGRLHLLHRLLLKCTDTVLLPDLGFPSVSHFFPSPAKGSWQVVVKLFISPSRKTPLDDF